ncbi:MAG: helix-turn-helix transcriptional regulator [Cyanobacteria bacterium P01_H01_bin.152]
MGEIYVSKIAGLRQKTGLTQEELARAIGVGTSTIRGWERNRAFVDTIVKVARLCEALDCDPTDLYEAEDLMIQQQEE